MTSQIVVAVAPHVVLARLADSIDRDWPNFLSSSGFAGSKAFVGHVGRRDFRVQCRQKNRNGFAPQLYGYVVARDGRTEINYKISMHHLTKAVMGGWFTLIALVAIAFATLPTSGAPASGQLHPGVWTALAVLAGISLLAIGRVGWRDDVSSLERFICDTAASIGAPRAANTP